MKTAAMYASAVRAGKSLGTDWPKSNSPHARQINARKAMPSPKTRAPKVIMGLSSGAAPSGSTTTYPLARNRAMQR